MAGDRGKVRRSIRTLGIAMLVVGLGLLGYVGWEIYGTNYTSQRAQKQVAASLERQWKEPKLELKRLDPRFIPKGHASALIRIPAFGRRYLVPVLEGVSQNVLARGFGHFPNTAQPGQIGNYALAGHRITHGQPLRQMPELRPGDKIIVETATATYTYRLDTNPNQLIIPFTGIWVLAPLPKNPDGGVEPAQEPKQQRLITLTTCSELFHTDNRMIAFGHLVSTVEKN